MTLPSEESLQASFLPPPYTFSPYYHSPVLKLRDETPTGEVETYIVLRQLLSLFISQSFCLPPVSDQDLSCARGIREE